VGVVRRGGDNVCFGGIFCVLEELLWALSTSQGDLGVGWGLLGSMRIGV
jgi:hypothetical protein